MKSVEVVRAVRVFLDRTPIQGAEAETMAVCKQWISATEKRLVEAENPPPTPPPKVGESGKKTKVK